jgi:glucosylceramidase
VFGFGGCFNEAGWYAVSKLSEKRQKEVMFRLFDRKGDLRFTICRMPVGASDYAINYYSLNDTNGDYAMEDFSIERDRRYLIPYIKAAQNYNNRLKIWASPWTPPAWMKMNQHYACASGKQNNLPKNLQGNEGENLIIENDSVLRAYARYLTMFVKEYRNEGVEIAHIQVQNEFNSCQVFPSCTWTPQLLAKFIGQFLGPAFEKSKVETEIWLGTIERPNVALIDSVMADSLAQHYIKGMGFQWGGKGAIANARKHYPHLPFMQTETECGNGANDWAAAGYTFSLLKHYFEAGANAYLAWNMVLEKEGKSSWGWQQNALISVDTVNSSYRLNPEYYLFKHFSHFVMPHSKKIDVTGKFSNNALAFITPDNKKIIVLSNNTAETMQITIKSGKRFFRLRLPAHSLHTLMSFY